MGFLRSKVGMSSMLRSAWARTLSTYYEEMVKKHEAREQLLDLKKKAYEEKRKKKDGLVVRFWRLPRKEMVNEVDTNDILLRNARLDASCVTLDVNNLFVKTYIQQAEKAEKAENEDEALIKLHGAYYIYEGIRMRGFEVKEETYTPIYKFLMNRKHLVEQFKFFRDRIIKYNPDCRSNLLYIEATSNPNIKIEDMIAHYKDLLEKLKIAPTSQPVEKFMKSCCDSLEVTLAVDLLEYTVSKGLTVTVSTLNEILKSFQRTCDYHMVYKIQSIINDHKLGVNHETFRVMISLYVNLKNFKGAYDLMKKMRGLGIVPNTRIYNTIMVGFLKEKRVVEGLKVLAEMDASNVKPDSHTFSYLIGHCTQENDIIKYYNKFKESGVQPTKHIFTALINAYAACGKFEKAKQILSDKTIPQEDLNEIKNTLVNVLATCGQMSVSDVPSRVTEL